MNIFTSFKGIFAGKQGDSGRSVLHSVNDYLISLVNREDMIEPVLNRYNSIGRFGFQDNREELIKVYFLLENFIIKHKPVIVKKEYTKEELRTYIRNTWIKGNVSEIERLIFDAPESRVFRMYRIVISQFIKYARQSLGDPALGKFFAEDAQFKDFVKYHDGSLEYASDISQALYKQIFSNLYKLVSDALGEKYAEGQIRKMFEWCRNTFDFEIVSLFFDIIPDTVLSGERLSVLNRDELEFKIVERTEELRMAKEKVEDKVKERTAELENERAKLSIVTENMAEGAIVMDKDMNVIFTNASARRHIGIESVNLASSSEEINKSVIRAFGTRFTKYPLTETLLSARDAVVVIPEIDSESQIFKLTFNTKLNSSGQLVYYLVWIEDITEAKALERRKSEFVSIAAHQLRTPLSAMKWALHMVVSGDLGDLTADQNEFIVKAYDSNDRMISLVNDLLNTDKIDSGKIKLEFTHTTLDEIFKSLNQELYDFAKLKNIKYELNTSNIDLAKQKVYADQEKLRAVFQNLIDNAIKYSPSGETVEVVVSNPDKFTINVKVIDHGIGIPESDQKNIFTRFFRAPNAQKIEADGSGLGLYIAKSIVESHGGSVKFSSKINEGTTFEIELPLDKISGTIGVR